MISYISITFGIWNTGVPLGDEAGYLSEGLKLVETGGNSANLYHLGYCIIFRFITPDLIKAHYLSRFLNSFISVILIFRFFTEMRTEHLSVLEK